MSSTRERRVRVTGWFLSFSYAVGAPVTAYAELTSHAVSQRFDYPPAFIYLVCAIQLVCSVGVLVRRFAPWAAAALTVITLGAIVSHLRIGSPVTTVPALIYTAVQIWYGRACRARENGRMTLNRLNHGWILACAIALAWAFTSTSTEGRAASPQTTEWPWDDSLDAVAAAPHSHAVLFENDEVRVVDVSIGAGEKEPDHTHRNPSVMIVYQPTRIRYFGVDGEAEFESPEGPS